jgi:hypothetical protein
MILHYFKTKENMLSNISEKIYNDFVSELLKIDGVFSFEDVLLLFNDLINSPVLSSQVKFWLDLINASEYSNEKTKKIVNMALKELKLFFDRILIKTEANRKAKIDMLVTITEGLAVLSKVSSSAQMDVIIKNIVTTLK